MWQQILNFLNQGWVGSLLGVLGILTGFFFYLASTKRKILAYDTRTTVIISDFENQISDLDIAYQNKPIKNLAKSRVFIWNEGRSTIKAEDIYDEDSLKITVDGEIIGSVYSLDYLMQNQVEISLVYQGEVILNLKYLAHGDGILFEFFHTWSEEKEPRVKGTIIGFGSPQKRVPGISLTHIVIMLSIYSPVYLVPYFLHSLYLNYLDPYFGIYELVYNSIGGFWTGLMETVILGVTSFVFVLFFLLYIRLKWVNSLRKMLTSKYVKVADWPLIRWPSDSN